MKAALILLLASAPALSCDWTVTKTVDPMPDKTMCRVTSPTAKVTFYKYADERPNVVVVSAYKNFGLQIRIDDNEAVWMGENFPSRMRAMDTLLPQLQGAKRIRTSFRDYPDNQAGDAPVCNLPELLASC